MREPREKGQADQTTYERDMEDLARFRAALEKLNPGQRREVIQQMLAPPDTP